MCWNICYALVILHIVCIPGLTIEECSMEISRAPFYNLFALHGTPLPTTSIQVSIKDESPALCMLNTTAIVESLQLDVHENELTTTLLALQCSKTKLVYAEPYIGTTFQNIILFVYIYFCSTDKASLLTLASIANTKGIQISPGSIRSSNRTVHQNETALQQAALLVFTEDGSSDRSIMDIFEKDTDAEMIYPQMAEIFVTNLSMVHLPDGMQTKFPNLQTLEISGNNFSKVPETFPWNNYTLQLPNNLSRTPFMQDSYINSEHIVVANNIFRRFFNLDNNRVKNLKTHLFRGFLHKISLKRNGLEYLGQDTFVNVIGLQHLDLSVNEIRTLPSGIFRQQKHLRKINLSNNKLTQISEIDFEDLTTLIHLNIANNSIVTISDQVFAKLQSLRILNLENNKIHTLIATMFPTECTQLQEIYLQNNLLKELPNFVFTIRGLTLVNIRNNAIQFKNLTNYLLKLDMNKVAHSVIDSASDTDVSDLFQQSEHPAKVDLSYNKIDTLTFPEQASMDKDMRKYVLLFLHFTFDFTGNPLKCDCKINGVVQYINDFVTNGTIINADDLFRTWTCESPLELINKPILQVEKHQTYCQVVIADCPLECTCFERTQSANIIVDCRSRLLSHVHSNLPAKNLELWYSHNNISLVGINVPVQRVIVLDFSHNVIKEIDDNLFLTMKQLRYLDLRYNLLASLPRNIKLLKIDEIQLFPNPFQCDCRTLWMKRWLNHNRDTIKDWNKVTCNTQDEKGHALVDVSDSQFICKEDSTDFDELKHVILPTVICLVIGIICIVMTILTYTFRMEVKVMLFIYFGVHPFDSDDNTVDENIDCIIVHSGDQTDWVMEKLVSVLETVDYNFVVCDMARDFIVGFSFKENLTKTVTHSKRMIFLISQDWQLTSDSFTIAWAMAQEKMKDTRSNFGIIVTHEVNNADVSDKDVRLFITKGRYIDSSERLFAKKILYFMPRHGYNDSNERNIIPVPKVDGVLSKCFINSTFEPNTSTEAIERTGSSEGIDVDTIVATSHDVFISYADDCFDYAMNEVVSVLEGSKLSCCIPDRDFLVGASKEENILGAIGSCLKTVFVLSPSHVSNEWSLFTFRAAYEKSLREKYNHLLVIVKKEADIDNDIQDEEVKHYLKSYIYLTENDRWFKDKLLKAVLVGNNTCNNKGLDTLESVFEVHSDNATDNWQ